MLGIRQFADSLSCPHLVAAADKYIHHYFCKVSKSDEFLGLSTTELLDIVRSDELNVSSEEAIFEAAMRWIKHDEISRRQLLPKVIFVYRLFVSLYFTAELKYVIFLTN